MPASTRAEGDNVLTLDCTTGGGVKIGEGESAEFLFVVPVGAFKHGFHVVVISENSSIIELRDLGSTTDHTITRSTVENIESHSVGTAEYQLMESISSTGKAYIKWLNPETLNDNFSLRADLKAKFDDTIKSTGVNRPILSVGGSRTNGFLVGLAPSDRWIPFPSKEDGPGPDPTLATRIIYNSGFTIKGANGPYLVFPDYSGNR